MSKHEDMTFIANLYKRYELNIRKLLMHRSHHRQDVEDIVQDTFLKAHKVSNWGEIDNPEAYLVSIAKSAYNNHTRKKIKNIAGNTLDITQAEIADDRPTAERIIAGKQDMKELGKVINSLTPRLKQAVIMIKVRKLSYVEASEIMNISKRTLENHVANAMAECRRKINTKARYSGLRSYNDKVISLSEHRFSEKKTNKSED